MNKHVRIVGALWAIVGAVLSVWSVWGLVTEEHFQSVVTSWLIALGPGVLAIVAGVTFGHTKLVGRVLVYIVSGLALLYALAWLFLGGVDDASSYAPAIAGGVALSIYALFACKAAARAA